uniref:Thymidylate synthase/dCMP hydroxymethylase domain-containing protein n=1 Tax=Pseudo-nitzschia australis TaxID=44445 RepID=A0A7S4EJB0_9STRA|eukprot:CAMPEP_0168166674 /NCGR_PEP_ID=MMETSP0139_2-20121125/2154_1 /TAXON_ID=44445 /ORGANISM="Pseudo-nitzschia australis, Strain 10249 10 AB" /LENGTH=221 /DNA_ID=CAMNT_0008083889 /DNA_START=161 /DNA_END=826 /DNA_ORIENTATION=+
MSSTTSIKCAPSNNLNVGYPQFPTAKELHASLIELTSAGGGGEFIVRNFVGVIRDVSVSASTVETDLFPKGALDYYTAKNMGWKYTKEDYEKWQLAERGGAQGDYREGMKEKIANVIDCLKTEPLSKRAVIPIPYATMGSAQIDWKDQGQNKCCRELHFYLEDGKLKCTGIVRMQNANIFVKNIHFFATLIEHVANELNVEVGEYTHWITNVCLDRSATSC